MCIVPSEERFGQELRSKSLRSQRVVTELDRERRGELGVLDGLGEPLVEPEEARRDTLVRNGEDLRIAVGL